MAQELQRWPVANYMWPWVQNRKILSYLIRTAYSTKVVTDLEEDRRLFAIDKSDITLEKAMVDADVFVGLSVGNTVTPEMIKSMAKQPIVFAMANPDPEITYDAATAVRGRSHNGDGPQRLSESGEQCTWVSIYISRSARCTRHPDK